MVKTLDPNQTQKIDRPYVRPIYFCHLLLSGLTLYFSDRCFLYNANEYEDYLFDLSDIEAEIGNLGGYDNSRVTLRFKDDPIWSYSTLTELFAAYPTEKKYVEIYKLYVDAGETFGSEVSTKIFKGEMGQPYEAADPPDDFKVDCSSMLFGKNAALPLNPINLTDFPYADPDDVGKYRNRIIGSHKKVICPWTVAGWASTLTADIAVGDTTIVVSDSNNCPATPFTSICDNEQIRVTANTKATGTLTVTRGYGGTTAVAHNKGAQIYEQRSDFEAEVSEIPVKSIGDIYVKRGSGEWLRVISGVTKYTNSGGRAKLVFSDQVKVEEKTNQTTSTNTGTHIHTASTAGYSTKQCIPTGATGGTNPTYAIDGNDASYCGIGNGVHLNVTFTETNLGTINKQYAWIRNNNEATSSTITFGGTNVGTLAPNIGYQRFVKSGGQWNDAIDITGGASGNQIAEVYKEVEYTPSLTIDTHAADGVSATLGGNSVANMVIGDLVACDVDGCPDDGSGTYTGTPNALIERPDHVRKFILMNWFGFAAGDIGGSFATVGATYAGRISGGYKFAFVVHEIATQTMELFKQMDLQSRSNLFESGGLFQLAFGSTGTPTSQKTFSKDNIIGSFKFSKTEVVDVKNKLVGYYFKDHSKSGSLGEMYQKNNKKIDGSADLLEEVEFGCIGDLGTMVDDVLDWLILWKKCCHWIVEFTAKWDAIILEHCDYFDVTTVNGLWNGAKFRTLRLIPRFSNERIDIKGLQFISS